MSEPRVTDVHFAAVEADHLRIRVSDLTLPGEESPIVYAHIGQVLSLAFDSRAKARAFFAAGLKHLDELQEGGGS